MSFIAEEQREYTHIAHLLVDKGADISLEMADEGGSLLWHALRWDLGLAQAMQEKGAASVAPDDAYAEDDPDEQLRTAILHHDTPKLDELLEQSEMSVETLHECVEACVEADNLPVLQRLLQAGYDWEDEEGEKQLAPLLSMALSCRSFLVAMYLIEQAEAQQPDWSDVSAYELAEAAGHAGSADVLKKMLPHCGELLKKMPGSNGLRDAIAGGAVENVRVLIEAGATLDYVDEEGGFSVPVLADCVASLSAPVAQQLMAAGADPFMIYTDPEAGYDQDAKTTRTAATMVLKERLNRDPEVVALFAEALLAHEADTDPVPVDDFTVYSTVRESASFQEDSDTARLQSKQDGSLYKRGLVQVKRMISSFRKNKKNQRNNDRSGLAGNVTESRHDNLLLDDWEEA